MMITDKILLFVQESTKHTMLIQDGNLRLWATQYMFWLRDRALGAYRICPLMPELEEASRIQAKINAAFINQFGMGKFQEVILP